AGSGTPGVPVRFHALGGATPVAAGRSETAEVLGTVTSDTTITGTTPAALVCGVAAISFEVTVVLESGVTSNTFSGAGLTFTAPSINPGGFSPANVFSEQPTAFTITGTGFGPAGGTA